MSEITVLPPATDPRWGDVATGKIAKPWSMLAMKIMMMRITNETKADPSAANVEKCAKEVRGFFEKNMKMAQSDLVAIFS